LPKYKFWLDGKCSADYGVYLQEPIKFTSPEPNVTTQHVPGKNGDVKFWDGSYTNCTGTARCFVLQKDHAGEALVKAAEFFNGNVDYLRLETEYEPDIYRMVFVANSPDNDIRLGHAAPFTVVLDCKPQRYLKTGERAITITTSGTTIRNPTKFDAKPLITVYGSGASILTVAGAAMGFEADFNSYATLDCELETAYKSALNLNSIVTALDYPVLSPGNNVVGWSGGITSVSIIPRWWTL